ncbi:nitroreductase family protein [Cytobacillus sp. FJAT-54145]|uniref:Nitroreductase family protein n=1 Tax=Cytobacillus spartinae TaxID=3299023 RepID=A0ABW6K776_9BACI
MNQSMIETMKRRQSIRTYDNQPISEQHIRLLQEFISSESHLVGPFGRKGKMELIQVTNNVTDKGIKLGTYGFIKNPKAYVVGICENDKYSLVEFAYNFHKLVLFATQLGMGTCWMGGTFSRNSFEEEITLRKVEFIPCVTPVGYPKEKQRIFDKAVRYVVKADNKKKWDKLFYEQTFEKTLEKTRAGDYETPIEMVRLGPSASNKQPWRLVLSESGKVCHFFIEHTPNYSSSLGYDMQLLDMGIAMCQFETACKELNLEGHWVIEDTLIDMPNGNFEYIVSWKSP